MKKISWIFVVAALATLSQAGFAAFESPLQVPTINVWKPSHIGVTQRGSAITTISLEQKQADFVILPYQGSAAEKVNPAPQKKFYRLSFKDTNGAVSVVTLHKTEQSADQANIQLESQAQDSGYRITVSGRWDSTLLVNMERLESGSVADRAALYLDPVMTIDGGQQL